MKLSCFFLVLVCAFASVRAGSLTLEGFELTWTNRGQQTDFTISSALGNGVTTGSAWIGFGLNKNPSMNDASVVICVNSQSGSSVQHNYNSNYFTQLIDASNKQLGLSNTVVSVADRKFTCSFTRDNSNANAKYLNLNENNSPYVIVAYGGLSATGDIVAHSFKAVSSAAVSFPAAQPTTTASPTTTLTPIGSFQNGAFNVVWSKSAVANALDFTVSYTTSSTSNIYVAIGFSKDGSMGNDDVNACVYSSSLKEVGRYYNPGGHQPPAKQANNNGISNQAINLNNGVLTCSFTRLISTSEANYFDLNTPHFLLVAAGNANDAGSISFHSTRVASAATLNFQPKVETTAPAPTTAAQTTTTAAPTTTAAAQTTTTTQAVTTTTNAVTTTTGAVTAPPQTTTSSKPATSSILTTLTQTVKPVTTTSTSSASTARPNPVAYFSDWLKKILKGLLKFFGARE